jgi:hypothetical protein
VRRCCTKHCGVRGGVRTSGVVAHGPNTMGRLRHVFAAGHTAGPTAPELLTCWVGIQWSQQDCKRFWELIIRNGR